MNFSKQQSRAMKSVFETCVACCEVVNMNDSMEDQPKISRVLDKTMLDDWRCNICTHADDNI